MRDGSFGDFSDAAARAHYCAHPIQLVGTSSTVDTRTGEVVSSFRSASMPLGVVFKPCGNRRAHLCPSCSQTYARDTFELIRTGVAGGKTVPTSVAGNPLVFATFTAPSFGPVHSGGERCRPRRRNDRTRC